MNVYTISEVRATGEKLRLIHSDLNEILRALGRQVGEVVTEACLIEHIPDRQWKISCRLDTYTLRLVEAGEWQG